MNVLFATSEAFPLVKTGGLGDISKALPNALAEVGLDVRLVLPAYPEVFEKVRERRVAAERVVHPGWTVRVIECRHFEFHFPLWLIDVPGLFDRVGNPYVDADGAAWPDNDERFYVFSQLAASLASGDAVAGWRADVVHCNDWQTGLVPAMLSGHSERPCTVFTIHNVSYDCLFEYDAFTRFGLPSSWWSIEGGEFHHRFSMLKSGIVYSDAVTTVSEGYAAEICTPEFGYGYAGILAAHRAKLTGIVNGVDDDVWNPRVDERLAKNYARGRGVHDAKRANLDSLLERLDAPRVFRERNTPVAGYIGRLVHQKGIDLLLAAIPAVLRHVAVRFILAGTGESGYESRIRALARDMPEHVVAFVGYSEQVAHLLEAGCDLFVMPSRFEPCGLNQMYSMLYGTPPVVRRTGGLADTVVDATPEALADGTATGFVFDEASPASLVDAVIRAVGTIDDEDLANRLIDTGMAQDFGWAESAVRYRQLYETCLASTSG